MGRGDRAGAGGRNSAIFESGGTVLIEMLNCDCMDYMATQPDKAFDLAIVDPPYGININNNMGRRKGDKHSDYAPTVWDNSIPDDKYFDELFRVSQNQIIWGGNYFPLNPTPCWILWDKGFSPDVTFAQFEMAWTSFGSSCKKFDHSSADPKNRIHPTQKPVALYKWLLSRYAKPGDRILDTHGGSGSICIACHDLGYDLTWMELDADYYKAACKRYQNHAAQGTLFDQAELTRETKEGELF
jgi:site-specific DNA-methyltransferase (adenine-specific)